MARLRWPDRFRLADRHGLYLYVLFVFFAEQRSMKSNPVDHAAPNTKATPENFSAQGSLKEVFQSAFCSVALFLGAL